MILIISTCKEKLHELEFVKPIEDILKNNKIKFKTINYRNLDKHSIEKSDKIIITGTSLKDNSFLEKSNLKKFEFIKYSNKPILGICAGMHIIGLVNGGKLKKEKQIGPLTLEFIESFLGIEPNKKHQVYSLHGLYVDFTKLENFNVLSYASCSQAVKHKSKEAYGILFHPEVRNKIIIEKFICL
ncbi:MAG: hypothetical protein AABX03_04115 [Nanoarchaeota archaeon]